MIKTTIAIDAMGGDFGPPITVPAAIESLAKHPNLYLILVGDSAILEKQLSLLSGYDAARISIQHASQQVEMAEAPALALRNKKDSSMRVAINLVKEGTAQACLSAGNTGALMATARFVLKTLPGIERPAIISTFPTFNPNKKMRMLDLGANVDSKPEHLMQFAVMGSILASAVDNIPNPKVYLLNIGEEEIKGNEQVKQTAQLLASIPDLNYAGFVEAHLLNQGIADVVVCDGFVGNVVIKTSEGIANFIRILMKEAFMRSWYTKFLGLLIKPIMQTFRRRIDPDYYNGATFIGLQGTVIKSHGGATKKGFMCAIDEALIGAERNIPERIRHELEKIMKILSAPKES